MLTGELYDPLDPELSVPPVPGGMAFFTPASWARCRTMRAAMPRTRETFVIRDGDGW